MQTVLQTGNNTLNAVQLLFTRELIPEITSFWHCCQTVVTTW